MIKKLGIGCGGLLLVLFILGLFADSGGKDARQSANSTPGAVIAQATTAPTATSTPVVKVGTRQNPVPFKDAYAFQKSGRLYGIGVLAVERNARALVKKANLFNPDPPAGNDYILVQIGLVYQKGPEDKPFKTTDGGFKLYADNRFWGAPSIMNVAPSPEFIGQDIFPGAKVIGWLPGKYLPSNLMDQAVLVYDDVYFALK